jgi:muramidase (phage lysozyme)
VSSYKVAFPACTSASLATSPSGRAATGATVTLTASAAGCPTPTYRFLVGGSVVQAYSTTSTFSWNAAGKAPGTYSLEVDVRNQGSPSGYEAYAIVSYSLTGCSAAHLTTSKSSPQAHGATVVLTASATCPGTPQYRFLVGGAVVQDYSATSSFSWTGTTAGSYSLEVDVRDAGSGAGYESWAIVPFTLS